MVYMQGAYLRALDEAPSLLWSKKRIQEGSSILHNEDTKNKWLTCWDRVRSKCSWNSLLSKKVRKHSKNEEEVLEG